MLLRFVAIALLVLIALRLLGRMVATFLGGPAGRRPAAGSRTGREARPPAGRPPEQRQLEPCPHCGTYFDPERALAAPGGTAPRFCSAACLDAHALEAPAVDGGADGASTGGSPR